MLTENQTKNYPISFSPQNPTHYTMFILRKTVLKPTQSPSILRITSCFFSKPTHQKNPNSENPNPEIPTSASYDHLITMAGRSRDFNSLANLLNKRTKDGCFNTTNTFKFVTEEDDPNTILEHLIQTLIHLDKGFARKNAFDALISRLCKSNRIDDSLRVIDTMIQGGHGINTCTFHPLLNTLTRKKKMEDSWRILAMMRDNGIPVDVTAYNYILTGYCMDGDLKAASGVLKKILEEGLKEDSRTYDAMVLGACRVGRVDGALEVLRRMEEEGVSVLYCTHAHVISGLLGLGCFAQAVEFVMAFGGRDKALDTQNFGSLGSWLLRKRRFEEAKLVLGEMDKRALVMGEKLRNDYSRLLLVDDLG